MAPGLTSNRARWTLLACLFAAVPLSVSADPAPKKVAVLVNMGDPGPLGATLAKDQKDAKAVYEKLGYRVIVLSNDSGNRSTFATRQNLQREISGLTGVTDFKLDIIGHGRLQNLSEVPAAYRDRFPEVKHRDEEKKAGSPLIDFDAGKKVFVAVSVTNELEKFSDQNNKQALESLFRDSIGAGDIRKALEDLQNPKKNPGVQTTMHMLNCFGGALGQEVSGMAGVQIFNAAEASKTASQYHDPKNMHQGPPPSGRPNGPGSSVNDGTKSTLNYMALYYKELAEQKSVGTKMNYNDLHTKVARKMLDDLLPKGKGPVMETLDLPRSAAQSAMLKWCSTHPEGSEIAHDVSAMCDATGTGVVQDVKADIDPAWDVSSGVLTDGVNSVSAEAYSRLDEIIGKYCSNPEMKDPGGVTKQGASDDLEKTRKLVVDQALKEAEKDLARAYALLATSTPEGRTALGVREDYKRTLDKINAVQIKKGMIPYKSPSEIPTDASFDENLRWKLKRQWTSYQAAWAKVREKNPELKRIEGVLQKVLVDKLQEEVTFSRNLKMEARSIEKAERAFVQAKNEFDFMGMVLEAKAKQCFVAQLCDGVSASDRIRPANGAEELKRQRSNELSDLLETARKFSVMPNQDAQILFQKCVSAVSRGMTTVDEKEFEEPSQPGAQPTGPPQGQPTRVPTNGGGTGGGGNGGAPDEAPKTPKEVRAYNGMLLSCVEDQRLKRPYAAASLVVNSANLIKDTDGKCPYWIKNRDLYKSDLACGRRFSKDATPDEAKKFLNILRQGEGFP